jgi:hypothetical protein
MYPELAEFSDFLQHQVLPAHDSFQALITT